MATLEERVCAVIVDRVRLDIQPKVAVNATLVDDLEFDSLDIVELVMAFEEEFGIEVPDSDGEKFRKEGVKVSDLVAYLRSQGCAGDDGRKP